MVRLALRSLVVLALGVLAWGGRPAAAQSTHPSGPGTTVWTDAPLADVLYDFGDRSGLNLVFAVRVVRDKRVSARYTAGEDADGALRRILAGTGVLAQALRPGQYVLVAEPLAVTLGVDDDPVVETGTLDGRVVDAATGEPLPGASVLLVDLRLGAVADLDGAFAIPDLPAGRYTARVTYVGYRAVRLALDVYPLTPRLPPVVRLQAEPIASAPAQVEAPVDAGPMPGVTDVAARGVAVVQSPAGRGDLAAALAALPGLTRTGGAAGRLVVRGADPDALRVLRDGVPVYEPWHAAGLVSTLQPEALGRILLHRGQFPANLGGGLAAILETESSSALAGDTTSTLVVSPVALRVISDARIGSRVALHVAGQRSLLGSVLVPGVEEIGGVWAVDPLGGHRGAEVRPTVAFESGEAGVGVQLSPAARLDVSVWGARDRLRLDGLGPVSADTALASNTSWAASARVRGLVGPRTFATVLVYTTRVASETTNAGPLDATEEALEEHAAALDVDRALGLRHTLSTGARITARTVEGAFGRGASGRRVEDRSRGSELSAYLADTWSPGLGWQLQAGLRAEAARGQGRAIATLSPRLFVRWAPLRNRLVLRAGLSRQTQAVQRLVRPEGPFPLVAPRWSIAGPSGPAASAWQAGAGMEWAPTARFALGVDVYGRLDRGVFRPDAGAPVRPSERASGFVRNRGRAAGLEVAARLVGAPWTVTFAGAASLADVAAPGAAWRRAPYERPLAGGVLVQRAVGPLGVGLRLDAAPGLARGGVREGADVRAGLAVGASARVRGFRLEALALAQARLLGWGAGSAVDPASPRPLASDARALPAIPTLSVSARW